MEPQETARFWCHTCNKEVQTKDFLCVVCGDGFIEPIQSNQEHLEYNMVNQNTQQPQTIPQQTFNQLPVFLPFQQLMREMHTRNAGDNVNTGPRVVGIRIGGNMGNLNMGGGAGILPFEQVNNMIQQIFGNAPMQMGDFANDAQTQNILNQLFMQHQNQGPPPASEDIVNNLPRIKITQEQIGGGMDPCSVCQCDFDVDEETVKLPCDHFFHSDCILPWFKLNNSCPVCRYELKTDNKEYEESKDQRNNK